MKTSRTLRTLVCAAVIMTIGCTGLIAHPKNDHKDINKIEKTLRHQPPKENNDLRTISGKLGVLKSHGTKYITITTSSKVTYVIDIDSLARDAYKNIPGNKDNFKAEDEVTLKFLESKIGSKVVLTGFLNRDTGVFSVIKSGTIARPQNADTLNAK